jgi:hypothetical protein
LADALAALHRLLEEYAPQWYTQELQQKAVCALQLLKQGKGTKARGHLD